jgi:glucan phosphoethanolaminetransferase (alkaline phosphatase superfamily)
MKELTFQTMIAVFEEIFGPAVFWAMVVAAGLVTLLYLYVLLRDRAVSWRKFLLAQLAMPVGAVVAVWIVLGATRSRVADLGGPIDVVVFLAVAVVGAVGAAILVYTAEALVGTSRTKSWDARRSDG